MDEIVYWDDYEAIKNMAHLLQKGGVGAGDSDTVIGLLATLSEKSKENLDAIKIRHDMPYLILVGDVAAAQSLSAQLLNPRIARLAEAFWPGPLTLIVQADAHVPAYVKSERGGIAIRVPAHAGLQKLLSLIPERALFSTSANISGKPIPKHLHEIAPSILEQVAFLVQGDDQEQLQSSTILDCTGDLIKVVREGAISREDIEDYLKAD